MSHRGRGPQQPLAAPGSPTTEDITQHVIVLPGGGDAGHADNEAEPVAEWLTMLSLSASVLSCPVQGGHPAPCEAVRAEVSRVRESGAERVALAGPSAGGHLPGHVALTASPSDPERVDAVVPCCPVVSMEVDTDRGAQREVPGAHPHARARAATSLDRLVTASAPPFFIRHTADDASVPAHHSHLAACAPARHGVPHAPHVLPEEAHGPGLAHGTGEPASWPAWCASWSTALGWLDGARQAGGRGRNNVSVLANRTGVAYSWVRSSSRPRRRCVRRRLLLCPTNFP